MNGREAVPHDFKFRTPLAEPKAVEKLQFPSLINTVDFHGMLERPG